jgi:hypothetical protein
MFGLVGLEKKYNLHTTVDKMEFLVRNLSNMHFPTTVVAFGTLALTRPHPPAQTTCSKAFLVDISFPRGSHCSWTVDLVLWHVEMGPGRRPGSRRCQVV